MRTGRPTTRRARLLLLLGLAAAVVIAGGVALAVTLLDEEEPQGAVASFESRPDLRAPEVTVEKSAPAARWGYTLVAPWRGAGQAGPMILDARGRMVWFRPMSHERLAMDFRVQRYQGEPVLTWWEGVFDEDGYGRGEYVIADRSYREITRFDAGQDMRGDFHEFLLTPRGTALITIYREVRRDLSGLGGPGRATVVESIVREVDVESGRVLLDWHAMDHVAFGETHEDVPNDPKEPFDFFHVNSIDVDHDGNLLVSARHTDTVYKIDRRTGEVLWRLGGERSDFTLGPGARFYSQHDARRQPDGDITLFDNSNPPQLREHSRAIRLDVNERTMHATLEEAIRHPLGLSSDSQANVQTLPGGDMFVGWGSQPYFTWFGDNGQVLFDAHFAEDTDVYRAYHYRWSGRPTGRPAISVDTGSGSLTAYASWNGATDVERWQLLAGPAPGRLGPVGSTTWEGFETTISADIAQRLVAVRAVAASGEPLGRSRLVRTND